jgi:hypothetical protein
VGEDLCLPRPAWLIDARIYQVPRTSPPVPFQPPEHQPLSGLPPPFRSDAWLKTFLTFRTIALTFYYS